MTRTLARSLLLTLSLVLAGAAHAQEPALTVTDAWIREAPPGAAMLAAYMTIHNAGDTDRILSAVDSDCFAHVMLHKSVIEDGMARMEHTDRIAVPAHGELKLEPGGYHLMMPAPDERLVEGDSAGFTLHFDGGDTLAVDVPVRRADAP